LHGIESNRQIQGHRELAETSSSRKRRQCFLDLARQFEQSADSVANEAKQGLDGVYLQADGVDGPLTTSKVLVESHQEREPSINELVMIGGASDKLAALWQ
jgi:hypothetical protein